MRCCLCEENKDLVEFTDYQQRRSSGRQCRDCVRNRSKQHYHKNKEKYIPLAVAYRKTKREEVQEHIYQYLLENPCSSCGEGEPLLLTFHHLLPEEKEFTVCDLNSSLNTDVIDREIKKCEVLCLYCHAIETGKQTNSYRYRRYASRA